MERASECCDTPLSLLCSVCKNALCRKKSQGEKLILQAQLQIDIFAAYFYADYNAFKTYHFKQIISHIIRNNQQTEQ